MNYSKSKIILIIITALIIFSSLSSASDLARTEFLISAVELNEMQETEAEKIKIIDVRSSGKYLLGHLPDAVHMWGDDLRAVQSWVPELIPKAAVFSSIAQEKGINNNSKLIIYGEQDSPWPARLWFIFNLYAHPEVRILDGGYQAWKNKDYETEILPYNSGEGDFEVRDVNNEWLINSDTIAENLDNEDFLVLDLRSEAEYSGEETGSGAPRRGRIPGSIHLEWSAVLDEQGNFRPTAVISELYQQAGVTKDKETIALLSHKGIYAAHSFFTLKLLGYDNIKLYDEAWVGWSSRSDLPVEMN